MNTDVIKVNLKQLLRDRELSMYRLAKDTEIAYTTLWKLDTGRAERIGFDILEKICLRLNCGPGDLFTIISGEEKPSNKKGAKVK